MMTALVRSSDVRVLSATGMHPDRWCEPECRLTFRSSENVKLATALVWIRPDPAYCYRTRWAVQVEGQDAFVCDIKQDRPTCIGFTVDQQPNSMFDMDFYCDYQVGDSGADKRNLSFVLSELTLGSVDCLIAADNRSEASGFSEFYWAGDGALHGRLPASPPETLVEAFMSGKKIAESQTDATGIFALQLSDYVAGHSARTLKILSQGVSIEIDVVLDPAILGGKRANLPLPVIATASVKHSAIVETAPPVHAMTVPQGDQLLLAPLLEMMTAQTAALRALLSKSETPVIPPSADNSNTGLKSLANRYGELFPMAANNGGVDHDIIFLGVIDWDFRVQRPQHLAMDVARRRNRVFYISIVFGSADPDGRFQILQSPELGVYEIRLKLGCPLPPNIYRSLDPEIVSEILAAIDEMSTVLAIREPVVIVEYPSWTPVACGIPGATVVHDCLDLVSGFEETSPEIVELEEKLISSADLVVTTSKPLHDMIADRRASTIIRNGADVELFAKAAVRPQDVPYSGKVIGYFGAIAHWFDAQWILQAAEAHSDWTIVLIGDVHKSLVRDFARHSNIVLLGERPYTELVGHLAYFDVAVIPFKLVDLILCTNPVKLYEYMAAGKPVVASAMPEVVEATDLVYIAENAEDFVSQVELALKEDSDDLRHARMEWAKNHGWDRRGDSFCALLDASSPKVSIVVLSYKNWEFTKATLWSILTYSDYRNLEIIVVDNGSGDEIVRNLQRFSTRDARIKLVLSDTNLGYAAGNNLGLAQATGEYVILLNNDTYVTKGWVRDLIRPLRLDKRVGLVSPLTNNIGNEQRVQINYANMEEMAQAARSVIRQRTRERFDTECVAFFCAAMRRDVIEKVGFLDESYGLGFFEDDDYCKRTLEAGYRIQIVDDVFVHHHLSASFNQLGQDKKSQLMTQNKAIFEARWGEWKPHQHRSAEGFC